MDHLPPVSFWVSCPPGNQPNPEASDCVVQRGPDQRSVDGSRSVCFLGFLETYSLAPTLRIPGVSGAGCPGRGQVLRARAGVPQPHCLPDRPTSPSARKPPFLSKHRSTWVAELLAPPLASSLKLHPELPVIALHTMPGCRPNPLLNTAPLFLSSHSSQSLLRQRPNRL